MPLQQIACCIETNRKYETSNKNLFLRYTISSWSVDFDEWKFKAIRWTFKCSSNVYNLCEILLTDNSATYDARQCLSIIRLHESAGPIENLHLVKAGAIPIAPYSDGDGDGGVN